MASIGNDKNQRSSDVQEDFSDRSIKEARLGAHWAEYCVDGCVYICSYLYVFLSLHDVVYW